MAEIPKRFKPRVEKLPVYKKKCRTGAKISVIVQSLREADLVKAKELAQGSRHRFGLALLEAKMLVTFDDPKSPHARWGYVLTRPRYGLISIGGLWQGSSYAVQGIKKPHNQIYFQDSE